MNNENYFVVIPYPVLTDPHLNDADKLVYAEVSALTNKEGFCYASNRYIGEILGKKTRAVQYAIEKLRNRGYILLDLKNEKGSNSERKIYLREAVAGYPMQNIAYPHAKFSTPPMQPIAYKNIRLEHKIDKLAAAQLEINVDNLEHEIESDNIQLTSNPELASLLQSKAAELRSKRQQADPKIKTEKQFHGLNAVDALKLPKTYTARIIKAVEGRPLHVIQKAIQGARNVEDVDGRAKYFFSVVNKGY